MRIGQIEPDLAQLDVDVADFADAAGNSTLASPSNGAIVAAVLQHHRIVEVPGGRFDQRDPHAASILRSRATLAGLTGSPATLSGPELRPLGQFDLQRLLGRVLHKVFQLRAVGPVGRRAREGRFRRVQSARRRSVARRGSGWPSCQLRALAGPGLDHERLVDLARENALQQSATAPVAGRGVRVRLRFFDDHFVAARCFAQPRTAAGPWTPTRSLGIGATYSLAGPGAGRSPPARGASASPRPGVRDARGPERRPAARSARPSSGGAWGPGCGFRASTPVEERSTCRVAGLLDGEVQEDRFFDGPAGEADVGHRVAGDVGLSAATSSSVSAIGRRATAREGQGGGRSPAGA